MPAVSEAGENTPALPRTWRPLGVRVAGVFFFAMLLVVCCFAWVGFTDEVRAQFTFAQRATVIGMGAGIGAVLYGLFRSRVTATDQGLTVVNVFRTHTHTWAEVTAIRMGTGDPWAQLRLADGSVRQVMALQGTDGGRAAEGVRSIRALIDAH